MNLTHWFFENILSIVGFILTLVFVSVVFKSRRSPSSTMAWLIFVAVVPYVGIPLYILLGGRKLKAQASLKEKLHKDVPYDTIPTTIDRLDRFLLAGGASDLAENQT